MRVGDVVRVTWPEGTMAFTPPGKDGVDGIRDLKIGEVGLVTSVGTNGMAQVLFPPGIVYDVVAHHLDVIA